MFESTEKAPVQKTLEVLNETVRDKVYGIDFADNIWYIYEIEDEDDI